MAGTYCSKFFLLLSCRKDAILLTYNHNLVLESVRFGIGMGAACSEMNHILELLTFEPWDRCGLGAPLLCHVSMVIATAQ